VSTEYAGNPSYAVTITVPTDDDEFDVASVDVPLEQLADRTAYLKQLVEDGIGFELTDAVLHGDTTFPDGSIDATVTDITFVASNGVSIAAAGAEAFLGGNNVAIGSTTTVAVTATTDMTVTVGDDLTIDANGDIIITGGGSSTLDIYGGRVIIPETGGPIELAAGLVLGGGTGDTIAVAGTLAANHNASFAAGKTVALGGTTTVSTGGRLDLLGSVTWRPAIAVTDGVHSVGKVSGSAIAPTGADTIKVPPAVLSADRDFTVRSAGAEAGNRMRFYSDDNAFYLFLKQDNGTAIAQLKSGSVAPAFGFWKWLELEHNGSANGWFIIGGQAG
jgi:hypothetical protein